MQPSDLEEIINAIGYAGEKLREHLGGEDRYLQTASDKLTEARDSLISHAFTRGLSVRYRNGMACVRRRTL